MANNGSVGNWLPLVVIAAVSAMGYVSLRNRNIDNQNRIMQLDSKIARLSAELQDTRETLAAQAVERPKAPASMKPMISHFGAVRWRLPAGKPWDEDGSEYMLAVAKALAPGYAKLKDKTPPPPGRAIVATLRVDADGRASQVGFVKSPSDSKIKAAIEALLRQTTYPKPAGALTKAFESAAVQLTFDP